MAIVNYIFNYTGAPQSLVVPYYTPGSLTFTLLGGAGGWNGLSSTAADNGGANGMIRGAMSPAAGTLLTVDLGGAGANGNGGVFSIPSAPGGGGPRPGGDGGLYGSHALLPAPGGVTNAVGGGGGGGSEMYLGALLVAVAGGGAGGCQKFGSGAETAPGGASQTGSGGQRSGASNTPPSGFTGRPGLAGTTSAAGLGGGSSTDKYPTYLEPGGDASGGHGGKGASYIYVPGSALGSSNCGGGGGGGGRYWGGGGDVAAPVDADRIAMVPGSGSGT